MSKLPRQLSYKKLVTALRHAGFHVQRQRGSHMILVRLNPYAQVIVPAHRSIAPGTLARILDAADLSVDDLTELL